MRNHAVRATAVLLIFLGGFETPSPTLHMIGDSTMADKPVENNPERGWGQMFPLFFDGGVTIANHARNGRSTRSFIAEGGWQAVLDALKQGDYVIIQFGHNDQSCEKTDRYTPPEDFRANLLRFVEEARAKGASPLLCTPIVRRRFDAEGRFEESHGSYPGIVRDLAAAAGVPLLDMHRLSRSLLEELGSGASKRLYLWMEPGAYAQYPEGKQDNTHFSEEGARRMAALAAGELRRLGHPLAALLKSDGPGNPPPAASAEDPRLAAEVRSHTARAPFPMDPIPVPAFPSRRVLITEHGAVGDGRTLNTEAFRRAIGACAAAGGGTVVVPPGCWLTGPIRLESNIHLRLERGSLVQFSGRLEDFPVIERFDRKSRRYVMTPPVYAVRAKNIAITGEGIMDGAGERWRYVKREKQTAREWKELTSSGGVLTPDGSQWWPSREAMEGEEYLARLESSGKTLTAEDFGATREYLRPDMVRLAGCEGVLLDGPTFRNSPKFHVHLVESENIIVRNVTIQAPWHAQNGDGLDLSSCRNVLIYNSSLDVGDDAICVKPSSLAAWQQPGPSCRNIVVADCAVYHGHGGFVIGSESHGGAENIFVSNCVFAGTDVGIRFKSSRERGGLVERVFLEGIRMRGIRNEAILMEMYYGGESPEEEAARNRADGGAQTVTERTPRFRDIHLSDIVCAGAARAILLNGLPEMPLRDITIRDASITALRGALCLDVDTLTLRNVRISSGQGPLVDLHDAREVRLSGLEFPQGTDPVVALGGRKTAGVEVEAAKRVRAGERIARTEEVPPGAVRIVEREP
ncbi:MAG: glycosyl hydrolase family 28 protein [Bacteroidota bacterium]